MIEIVDMSDLRATRNLRLIQDHYGMMINRRNASAPMIGPNIARAHLKEMFENKTP
jgi:hypothetical protein